MISTKKELLGPLKIIYFVQLALVLLGLNYLVQSELKETLFFSFGWFLLVLEFTLRNLEGSNFSVNRLLETILIAVLIPFFSIGFWFLKVVKLASEKKFRL